MHRAETGKAFFPFFMHKAFHGGKIYAVLKQILRADPARHNKRRDDRHRVYRPYAPAFGSVAEAALCRQVRRAVRFYNLILHLICFADRLERFNFKGCAADKAAVDIRLCQKPRSVFGFH